MLVKAQKQQFVRLSPPFLLVLFPRLFFRVLIPTDFSFSPQIPVLLPFSVSRVLAHFCFTIFVTMLRPWPMNSSESSTIG